LWKLSYCYTIDLADLKTTLAIAKKKERECNWEKKYEIKKKIEKREDKFKKQKAPLSYPSFFSTWG
jgi:hypothetical protein